jgi:hypothetical protein
MEETIEQLKEEARASWRGAEGEHRAERLEAFLRRMLAEYSEKLGLPQEEILKALESKRTYSCLNYYQGANFPSLEGVRVFETREELKAAFPAMQFRCPSCHGLSTNPYTCNTGIVRKDKKVCDWKAWGLFRTLGEGLRLTVKEGFLEHPRVEEIFMPVELERAA